MVLVSVLGFRVVRVFRCIGFRVLVFYRLGLLGCWGLKAIIVQVCRSSLALSEPGVCKALDGGVCGFEFRAPLKGTIRL